MAGDAGGDVKYSDIIARKALIKNLPAWPDFTSRDDLIGNLPNRPGFPPRLMRTDAAAKYLASGHLLRLMVQHGWIAPSVWKNRMKLYDRHLLDACCDRLAAGEFPDGPAV
jgi:hypothetical protein